MSEILRLQGIDTTEETEQVQDLPHCCSMISNACSNAD